MKCKLPALYVKLFAKAIHSLAKIGTEVYIEPVEDGLAVKTVNSSRSAYASFMFLRSIFQAYDHGLCDESVDEGFKCKVAVKTLLQVFKSLSSIEKSVESCEINLDDENCRLIFQLNCRHGIVKTHQLTFQECESLQAMFAKDLSPNVLQCERKLLTDVVINFPSSVEEITLAVTPCQVKFRSYFDDEDCHSSMLKTEMKLNPEEFSDFQIGVDTEITFCLKDMRAVLAFCDNATIPLFLHFETGGKPLVISIEDENRFKVHFVLATISNEDLASQAQKTASYPKNKHLRANITSKQASSISRNSFNIRTNEDQQVQCNLTRVEEMDSKTLPHDDDDTTSPEIPMQHTRAPEVTKRKLSSEHKSVYQIVKKVFYEPSLNGDQHSVVVLAPDSDDDNS